MLNFQDAIRVAYDFYLAHPEETLIVITADHDTGGMAIGHPDHYGHADLALVDTQRISKDRLSDYCRDLVKEGKTMTWEEMSELLRDKLGFWTNVPLTEEQTNRLRAAFDRTFVARQSNDEKGLYNTFNEFVTETFRIYNYWVGTDFISHNHTANPVPGIRSRRGRGEVQPRAQQHRHPPHNPLPHPRRITSSRLDLQTVVGASGSSPACTYYAANVMYRLYPRLRG